MLKALLKKQFLELNAFYFQDKKTGRHRSRVGTAAFIALYVLLFVGLGFAFYFIADLFASALVPAGMGWLYFGLMGIMSLCMGVFGGVFNTYAGLYHARDNEFLLSLPIPPSRIVAVRIVGVYAMGLMYEALIFVPTVIAYFVNASPGALSVVNSLLLVFVLGFVVLALTCFLGWIVALIASKLKNKSFVTVIIALAFFAVYYYFCMNYYSLIQKLLANSVQVGMTIKRSVYPVYLMGRAAEGDALSMVLFTAAALILLAATCCVLSRTFIKIASSEETAPRAVYKESAMKSRSVTATLFRKEWKRFSSSPTYMLNCALGSVFMPAAGVAALIFREDIREVTGVMEALGMPGGLLSIVLTAAVCMVVSMNDISAPSVSLEGKNIWILQTMPVNIRRALDAKLYLHWALTVPPAVLLTVCAAAVFSLELLPSLLSMLIVLEFVLFSSLSGLAINLKKPNLTWTNETAPIKQSLAVTIALFGGWALSIAMGAGGYFALKLMADWQYLLAVMALLAVFNILLYNWLHKEGCRIFEGL